MNDEVLLNIIKIGIPSFLGIIASFIAYLIGRKKQIDELMLKETVTYAKRISAKLQDTHALYVRMYEVWKRNFEHVELPKAMGSFEKYDMYENERENINILMKYGGELEELHKESAIFINIKFRNKIKAYLELGRFNFQHDGIGLFDNYFENFFANLIASQNKRVALFEELERQFNKLIK